MIIALLAATVLMADSTPALQAAATAAQPQAAATAEQNAKSKKPASNAIVCKNEPVLGSRLPTKRCRSAEQIAAQQQQDQADLDKAQRVGDPGH
jgi:hypothetical protein